MHKIRPPSAWVCRFAGLISSGGDVLDLACGSGRHTSYLLDSGFKVTAVDRDLSGLSETRSADRLTAIETDLESGDIPDFLDRSFDGIVVTDYLYRPLLPALCRAVAKQGVLIYETFAVGNEQFGRPRNPDFLLRAGELPAALPAGFQIVAYEHGMEDHPHPAVRQRICAIREPVDIPAL